MSERDAEETFGCARCWPSAAEEALQANRSLAWGQELIDDSHLGVKIRACPQCAQRFVAVFLEHIDWQDGDDSQYWTLMPITEPEFAELVALDENAALTRLNKLPPGRRCLQHDHPKGGPERTFWGSGMFIVP